MRHRSRFGSGHALVYGLMGVGLGTAALAPFILVIELYEWLTSSEWPGLTVADGLGLFGLHRVEPETEVQRLIDLVLAFPLSIALFFAGISSFLAGASLGDWRDERRVMDEVKETSPLYWLALIGASDVTGPTLIRLLLLDLFLRIVMLAGAGFLMADALLLLAGAAQGWLAAAGVALLLAAALTARVKARKLGLHRQAGGRTAA